MYIRGEYIIIMVSNILSVFSEVIILYAIWLSINLGRMVLVVMEFFANVRMATLYLRLHQCHR